MAGGTPSSLDGFCEGKSHRSKWMMTGGTPMTMETPRWSFFFHQWNKGDVTNLGNELKWEI